MSKSVYTQLTEYLIDNQNKFYRLAYSYVRNKDAAMDIVQNAICKALENYHTIRNAKYISTWFYRVLVNESLSFIKKNDREILYEPNALTEDVYIEQAYEPSLELYKEIDQLPEHLKTIIILHYYEGMTLKQIAQVTNTNISTVKTRLYASLKRLKLSIKEVAI